MESDSDTNLSLEKLLLMSSHWVMTKVVGQSIGKKFSDLKFAAEKLHFHLQYDLCIVSNQKLNIGKVCMERRI